MNTPSNTNTSRSALQRLVIVVLIAVGFVIYAYGWKITDISLAETQEPNRQSSVQRALRELLSPNIFDQDITSVVALANLQQECTGEETAPVPREAGQPYAILDPACGARNAVIAVEGFDFPRDSIGRIFVTRTSGERQPINYANSDGNTSFDIDGNGHFQVEIIVPNLRGEPGDIHEIQIESLAPVGVPYFSPTAHLVIEKMIETIFLALMATTLALPIAVVLSFFAARNLMREIYLPLGLVLVGLIFLPIGWILGDILLAPIGQLGISLGKDLITGVLGIGVAIVGFGLASRFSQNLRSNPATARIYQIAFNILLLTVILFILGALGGIGIWAGTQFTEGLMGYIGNFFGTLGNLVELTITPLSALGGAFLVSTISTDLSKNALRKLSGTASHLTGGILGAIGGGLLIAGIGVIGSMAALFTIIPPLVIAVLAGQLTSLLYDRWEQANQKQPHLSENSSLRSIINLGAMGLTFVASAHILNTLHFVVTGRTPPPDFITTAAIMGLILGGLNGLLSGVHTAFPLGSVFYNTTRTILNTLRSIEPLIMGIVFVIWVSIGPFAGVLALTLHSIASLGKLYSEQIENIDDGPIEAIQSSGATRLQTIIYAVVPQIIPPYIAFTMYRWDINVRMSTIIGFVGGGGIGFLLQQQINLLRYSEAGVAVLAIAIVVSVLDYASASIREHIG